MRKKYETDLTDEQWEIIAPLFVNMRKYKLEQGVSGEIYRTISRRFLPCTAFIDVPD